MPKLIITTNTGKLETSFDPPYTVREQLAWEEHFKGSFYAIEAALEEAQRAARGEEYEPLKYLRTSWAVWFGWFRLRPKVPANFDTFLATVQEWEVEATEEELGLMAELAAKRAEGEAPEPVPDPTVTPQATTEPSTATEASPAL